ncbi:MAG: hypothetical protein WBJ81_00840 [Rickettsiales bacterium]
MVGQSDINYTEKNLKYLTKKLFEAARLDMKADSLTNNKPDQENTALNNFLEKLLPGELNRQPRDDLKGKLEPEYNQLKNELKESRVFGVGKNASEKTKTIANNCLKIMSSFLKGISKLALQTVAEDAPKLTDNKTAMRNALKNSSLNLSETKISLKSNSNNRKSAYHGL